MHYDAHLHSASPDDCYGSTRRQQRASVPCRANILCAVCSGTCPHLAHLNTSNSKPMSIVLPPPPKLPFQSAPSKCTRRKAWARSGMSMPKYPPPKAIDPCQHVHPKEHKDAEEHQKQQVVALCLLVCHIQPLGSTTQGELSTLHSFFLQAQELDKACMNTYT